MENKPARVAEPGAKEKVGAGSKKAGRVGKRDRDLKQVPVVAEVEGMSPAWRTFYETFVVQWEK